MTTNVYPFLSQVLVTILVVVAAVPEVALCGILHVAVSLLAARMDCVTGSDLVAVCVVIAREDRANVKASLPRKSHGLRLDALAWMMTGHPKGPKGMAL